MAEESRVVELHILEPVMLPEVVAEKDVAAVQDALDKHTPANQTNQYDQTALHIACELGKEDVVALLITANAQLEAKDVDGTTPLSAASRSGSVSCVRLLVEAGADVHSMDEMSWTPLMWASYKGHADIVQLLLSQDANVHHIVSYNMTALIWAAARGYTRVVRMLLEKEAKVNSTDKFGSTSLIWASRRGYCEIVSLLLEKGADINAVGAGGANALINAAKNGYDEIIRLILQKSGPNVNHTDRDSNSALTYAAKQGKHNAILMLLNAGAYLNLGNRNGQTPLIKAAKYGHLESVHALLTRYADVDVRGKENWTALHYSCERGHIAIVKEILSCNPDLESVNDNGDTPLLLAVKSKNLVITRMLIDKGAMVSAVDKRKDTPLHVAIRARSVRIASLLLRKPQDARILYQPNNAGDTPYNLDASHNKSILASIFGAKNMSVESDMPDVTGPALPGNYDLYSSALADILSEPTLAPPLTVGLYAKWGSGKSLLLQKLEKHMQLFTSANRLQPLRNPGVISFLVVVFVCVFWGVFCAAFSPPAMHVFVGAVVSGLLFAIYCVFLGLVHVGVRIGKWNWATRLWKSRQKSFTYLTLLFKLWFMVPPSARKKENDKAIPVSRLTTVGGQTSLAEMIGLLCRSAEKNLGFMAVRLYRPFQDDMAERGRKSRFRKICCLPAFVYVIVFIFSTAAIVLTAIISYGPHGVYEQNLGNITESSSITPAAITMMLLGTLDVLILFIGAPVLIIMFNALMYSQRTRALDAAHHTKSQERLIQQLKQEVDLLCQTVTAIDAFTHTQTRMCVTINGLDSCEQSKILQVLDTIHILFSQRPYITILSIDPVIISKAIHGSLNRHSGVRRSTKGTDLGKLMLSEEWLRNVSPQLMKRVMHIVTLTGRLLRADGVEFSWLKLMAWIYVTEQWPYRTSFLLYILEKSDSKITVKDSLRSAYEKNSHLLNPNDPKLVIDTSDDLAYRSFISARSLSVLDVCNFLPCTVNLDPKLFDPISIYGNSPSSRTGNDYPTSVGSDLQRLENLNVPANIPSMKVANGNATILSDDIDNLTADNVADQLLDIKGLSRENASKYAGFVRLNNLNGAALLACELDDLKKELFAPFGDWCLLKQWIQQMKFNSNHGNVARSKLTGSSDYELKDDVVENQLSNSDRTAYDRAFKEYLRLQHDFTSESDLRGGDDVQGITNPDLSLQSSASPPMQRDLAQWSHTDQTDSEPLLILHSHPISPK